MGGGGQAFFKRTTRRAAAALAPEKPIHLLRPSELEYLNGKHLQAKYYLSYRPVEEASEPLDPLHPKGCSVEQHWDEGQKRCVNNGIGIVGGGFLSAMVVSLVLAYFSGQEALSAPYEALDDHER